uniref:Microtubule-associated protein 10 n=1 Tax=Castor canadensis TaxID=51338 RepID=A0A8B7VJQ4_CASCN|nr:microtubule-associated protein 10 [Castor canadensis]
MAAAAAERLFSLELLVDWVRLEAGPPPSPRAPNPGLAFRLLDFPPLLVRPPAAPAPASLHGAISFGRGKACLFRLRPAALRRPLLRAALLQLPPAPRLLGTCDIPLAAVAQGRRDTFALRDPAGQRVGVVALFHRLTDLGDRPAATLGPARGDPGSRALDALEPRPRDAGTPAAVQRDPEEALSRSKAHSQDASSSQDPRTDPDAAGSASSRDRSVSPLHPEVAEWDFAANTFCPPPLYYTNWTQEKTPPPARVEITIEPHRNVPEELDGVIPETKLVNPPTHPSLPKHENSATQERPPKLANPPHIQDVGAVNQTPGHPQTEQNMINTIRQLPLLNALLIELSLLYNQPVASPTHVHPHLAWLYRTEDKAQESSTKSTCQSGSKRDERSVGEHEKTVSSQYAKSQVENLKKGEYFEKNNGGPPKKVAKGRLLYGLTNTLRLRLKQTNPDMLIVHEKREQYRKMKAHMLGTKFRISIMQRQSVKLCRTRSEVL